MAEPARVRALPMEVANQIAAGEVVERPASVLKELAENSLDACCTRLDIELEGGGAALIRVRDDGVGIVPADLAIALSRHATSKVGGIDDLGNLRTLGFRGEALPSIASVSRLTLRSRVSTLPSGWSVEVGADGVVLPAVPAAMPPGTEVEVRDLFYNTPARRKFLRAERTELRHLELVLRNAALGRFDVAMRARHAKRNVLSVGGAADDAGCARRVGQILGRRFLEASRQLEETAAGMRLRGWIVVPERAHGEIHADHFFLNLRPIRDPVVRHALRVGFEGYLDPGRQPAYVLYLETEPGKVDVNVHPTKHEVRFRQARTVHDFIVSAVRRNLDPRAASVALSGSGQSWGAPGRAMAAGAGRIAEPQPVADRFGRVIAWIDGRYAITQRAEDVVVVDLHCGLRLAARQALESASASGIALRSRPLLVPVERPVSGASAEDAEVGEEFYRRFGIVVRRIGPERISLRQLPSVLREADAARVLDVIAAAGGEPQESEVIPRLAELAASLLGSPAPQSLADIQVLVNRLQASSVAAVPPVARRLGGDVLDRLVNSGVR